MKYFTLDNTEGFAQETLDMMNTEYEKRTENFPEKCHKSIGDQIFNEYC